MVVEKQRQNGSTSNRQFPNCWLPLALVVLPLPVVAIPLDLVACPVGNPDSILLQDVVQNFIYIVHLDIAQCVA